MSCSACTRVKKAPLCLSGTINIGDSDGSGYVIIKNALTGRQETILGTWTGTDVTFMPSEFSEGFLTPNGLYEISYTTEGDPSTLRTLTIGADSATCWLLEFENYYESGTDTIQNWENYSLIVEN
jgi:hypothetical protein